MSEYKSLYVEAEMVELGKLKGLPGRKKVVPTGEKSKMLPKFWQLTTEIQGCCNQLHEEGYEVISIIPVTRGAYTCKVDTSLSWRFAWGWGAGWGYTGAVVITARKMRKGRA